MNHLKNLYETLDLEVEYITNLIQPEMKITGKIDKINDIVEGVTAAQKAWKKRIIIIETEGQYPKKVAITLWGETCDQPLKEGMTAVFDVDVESREYNEKWYTDIKAWKFTTDSTEPQPVKKDVVTTPEDPDDLPF